MKKIISLFTTLCFVFTMLGTFTVFADEPAADLEISTLAELEQFRDDVNGGNTYEGKTVKLTADIDMSEKYGEGKESWTPIGINDWENPKPFSGTFDGCNHTINNLYINIPEYTGANGYGLFGMIDGTLKNLNVNGSVIAFSDMVAGIVVSVGENGSVINCSFDGAVKGNSFVGGIAVLVQGCISDCHCSGTVDGVHMVGGIVSNVSNALDLEKKGIVENCTNESAVTGGSLAGGIVGSLDTYAKATGCVNKGEVKGAATEYENGESIGGIAGANGNSRIENCYNTGLVSGEQKIGGITGVSDGPVSDYYTNKLAIKNCYNIGNVTAVNEETAESIGSIIGENTFDNGDIANNYYLDTCTPDALSIAASLTAEQFADKTNFTNWDFDTVWEMDETLGRPVLRSNAEESHIHKICGDENCADNHEDIEWTAWDSETSLPTEAGNYYLTKDVETSLPWSPADGTALCLNGYSIRQTDKLCVIRPEGVFSLCDCAGSGTVTGGMLGVAIMGEGVVFNMYGGKITENHWKGGVFEGGGVACYPGGVFNMYGGEISSNSSDSIGGVKIYGQMSIGGNAVIKDNTDAGGVTNNLFLSSNSTVTVASPLTEGAYIGIAYYAALMSKIPKTISGANDADYSKYFHSDNETYKIVNGENNILQFVYKNNSYPYYKIENVYATDAENNTLTAIPANTEFTVYGYIKQIAALEGTNYGTVIFAAYDENGALIDVGMKEITNPEYFPCSYTASLHSDERSVGSIKVFVWNTFNSMEPLAEKY